MSDSNDNFNSLSLSVDKNYISCGDTLTYTLVISNTGTTNALDMILKNTIPNGTSFVSGSLYVDNVNRETDTLKNQVYIGTIPAGQSLTVNYKLKVICNSETIAPWDYQAMLGKGLDVDWSKTGSGQDNYTSIQPTNFKNAGVSHVRIRIKDAATEALLNGLDAQIDDCLNVGLIPIVAYQAADFKSNPTEETLKAVIDWWVILADRYKDKSPKLAFNLIIETTDAINDNMPMLNDLYERTVTEIRKTNPNRILIIAPRKISSPLYLNELLIPTNHNGYLMAEWHFYAAGPSKTQDAKLWTTGTDAEKKLITDKIDAAVQWQSNNNVPTWVGAWMPGNYNNGNDYTIDEQIVFASYMTSQLVNASIPFAINSDTKFYDRTTEAWISEMQPVFNCIFKSN